LLCLVPIKPQTLAVTAAVNGDFFMGNFIHTVIALGALQTMYIRVVFHSSASLVLVSMLAYCSLGAANFHSNTCAHK
jgi:hypothetical protein